MIDRRPVAGEDPFLDWKVRIFFVGAALLIGAILFDRPVLSLAAVAVLGAGVVLVALRRFRARRDGDADPPS